MQGASSSSSSENSTVAAAMLRGFFEQHQDDTRRLAKSSKILLALIQNATKLDTEKYRKIKLSNATIQQHVVNVADAVDILHLAGFVELEEDPGERYLIYTPSSQDTVLSTELCIELERKIKELELQDTKAPEAKKSVQTTDSTSNTSSPFLSERESLERQRKAREARKIKEKERLETRLRLEEDKQERLAAAKRKEAVLLHLPMKMSVPPVDCISIKELATGRRIKKQEEDDKPTELLPNKEDEEVQLAPATSEDMIPHNENLSTEEVLAADALWKTLMKDISACEAVQGIRDTSVYNRKANQAVDPRPVTCLKRLYHELKELESQLPDDRMASIWVRFDEETPQFLRALLTAPLGTPYAGGLFCFDVYIPNDYPASPPNVTLLTTGGGRVRFGPNLYADGKVCLSLLGTWPGPKWSPLHSNLYQVLVSIQGLILGAEQPYYLEPGHGGWEGNIRDDVKDQIQQGQTLSGQVVQSRLVRVPPHVQEYNVTLRAGTIRFAMLETMAIPNHLKMFAAEIRNHFYSNRAAILNEVQFWMDNEIDTNKANSENMEPDTDFVDNLRDLVPKLKARLAKISGIDIDNNSYEDDKKMPAVPKEEWDSTKRQKSNVEVTQGEAVGDDATAIVDGSFSAHVDALKKRMQDAATAKNFILAGQLQEQLAKLKELEDSIGKAAAEGNYIRAGRFQEQLNALLNTTSSSSDTAGPAAYVYDHSAQNENFTLGTANPMGDIANEGLPFGKNVFAPPWIRNKYASSNNHEWGNGNALASSTGRSLAPDTLARNSEDANSLLPGIVIRKAAPPSSVCRLRFRLPHGLTHLEDFDQNMPLSHVYNSLEAIVFAQSARARVASAKASPQSHNIGPPLSAGGAWAQPESSAGFTFLLSHPKREFNLEMHGTKSLAELQLCPSATLTVMKCSDRGIARRGEVERRLAEASGGAMDVEGLSYEGLLELTERVGAADSIPISQAILDEHSTLLSPSDLVGDELNCPICLGDYDSQDETRILRKLHSCGHLMHAACLSTWLKTKSSCPLCKSGIVDS